MNFIYVIELYTPPPPPLDGFIIYVMGYYIYNIFKCLDISFISPFFMCHSSQNNEKDFKNPFAI